MPRYKVWVRVERDPQCGYALVRADSPEAAGERAEELFEEDPAAFVWNPEDLTEPTAPDIIRVEEEGAGPDGDFYVPLRKAPVALDLRVKDELVRNS